MNAARIVAGALLGVALALTGAFAAHLWERGRTGATLAGFDAALIEAEARAEARGREIAAAQCVADAQTARARALEEAAARAENALKLYARDAEDRRITRDIVREALSRAQAQPTAAACPEADMIRALALALPEAPVTAPKESAP